MKIHAQQDYPASLDRLWSVFGSAEYPEKKYRALGATHFQMLQATVNADLIEIELERVSPVALASLPDWARKFVKSEQTMRHSTRWQRQGKKVSAVLKIVPVGVPVTITGIGSIEELGPSQTRVSLEFDVDCKIPLLGGKIAALFGEQIRQAVAADYEFTKGYLAAAA